MSLLKSALILLTQWLQTKGSESVSCGQTQLSQTMKRNKKRFHRWECKECDTAIEEIVDMKLSGYIWMPPLCWWCDKEMQLVDISGKKT